MALKNVNVGADGGLYGPDGVRITIYDDFLRSISHLAFETQRRYSVVIHKVFDLLFELGALGQGALPQAEARRAMDDVRLVLGHGPQLTLATGKRKSPTYAPGDREREARLRLAAESLGIRGYSRNSWTNTAAPIKRLLTLANSIETQALQVALLRGVDASVIAQSAQYPAPLFKAIDENVNMSPSEVAAVRNSSMLAGVVRRPGAEPFKRPVGLMRGRRQAGRQIDLESLEFPEEHFPALLRATTSYRDAARYCLAFGAGLRLASEVDCLKWKHVERRGRLVFIVDPNADDSGAKLLGVNLPFKGRATARTYIREPYGDWFFEYLALYKKFEYSLPHDTADDFVFQGLVGDKRGRPLHEMSPQGRIQAFKGAVRRAKVPGPPMSLDYVWSPHSLRHGFAASLKNDFGLSDSEIQVVMGHESVVSTRIYARRRVDNILRRLSELETSRPQKALAAENVQMLLPSLKVYT